MWRPPRSCYVFDFFFFFIKNKRSLKKKEKIKNVTRTGGRAMSLLDGRAPPRSCYVFDFFFFFITNKRSCTVQYCTVLYSTVQTGSGSDRFRFMPVPVPTGSRLTEPGSRFPVRFRGFPEIWAFWCLPVGATAIQTQNLVFSPQIPRFDFYQLGEQLKERRLKNITFFSIVFEKKKEDWIYTVLWDRL